MSEELAEIKDRLDALEAENERLREENSRLEDAVDELTKWKDAVSAKLTNITERVEDVEEDVSEQGETTATPEDAVREDATPIEKLATYSEHELADHASPSAQRATVLFKNWKKWSRKDANGRYLMSTADLKDKLEAAADFTLGEDKTLDWRQLYRAMEALQTFSRNCYGFVTNNQGKKLLREREDLTRLSTAQA